MAGNAVVSHVIEVKAELMKQLDVAAEIIRGKMETHAKEEISEKVYDAPESWYRRTGLLRNSISTKVLKEDSVTAIAVGTNVDYAPFVELGTGSFAGEHSKAKKIPWRFRGPDGQWHVSYGVPARPFLRPAVEGHADEYKAVLKKVLTGES